MRQEKERGEDPARGGQGHRETPAGELRAAGAIPRTVPTTDRASVRRRRREPREPTAARVTVSTIASPMSPFNFEATICVVITRKLPPKT